jgi:hypothetical protein
VIEWGRAYHAVIQYVFQNQMESLGLTAYRPRGKPDANGKSAPKKVQGRDGFGHRETTVHMLDLLESPKLREIENQVVKELDVAALQPDSGQIVFINPDVAPRLNFALLETETNMPLQI